MRPFSYVRPTTPEDAIGAFARAGAGARFIAGGTNLYDLMKLNIEQPGHLIDVTAIEGLDEIETGGEALRFGALATMRDRRPPGGHERLSGSCRGVIESCLAAAAQHGERRG